MRRLRAERLGTGDKAQKIFLEFFLFLSLWDFYGMDMLRAELCQVLFTRFEDLEPFESAGVFILGRGPTRVGERGGGRGRVERGGP